MSLRTDAHRPSRPTRRLLVPLAVALVFAVIEVVLRPHAPDMAAQTARADLFGRDGYVVWWTQWYAGTSAPGYSLVTPPLLGLIGPYWLGAVAVLVTAALSVPLFDRSLRPTTAASLAAAMAGFDVLYGRTTFAVGVAVAVAAVLAADRSRSWRGQVAAGVLAAVATAASPVVGVLLLPIAVGLWWSGIGPALGSLLVLGVEAVAFGTEGYQPFSRASMEGALVTALALAVLPVGARVRRGAVAAAALVLGCYLVHTGVGSNSTRLALLAAPATGVAALRWRSRTMVGGLVAVALLLPLWQLRTDMTAAAAPQSTATFTAGLARELATLPDIRTQRVEVVDTGTHWADTYLLGVATPARGWMRQADLSRNLVLYNSPLSEADFRAFCDRLAVGYVALARGAKLDGGSRAEAALLATPPRWLTQIWQDEHWTLWQVSDPAPVVTGAGSATALRDTGVDLTAASAGTAQVRLVWAPWFVLDRTRPDGRAQRVAGAVSQSPDGDVELRLPAAGNYRLHAVWRWPW